MNRDKDKSTTLRFSVTESERRGIFSECRNLGGWLLTCCPASKVHGKSRLSNKTSRILFAHLLTLFIIYFHFEGKHQLYINRPLLFWVTYWIILGMLDCNGLRNSTSTLAFAVLPRMVRVAVGANICKSTSFETPPYPDVIRCSGVIKGSSVGVWNLVLKVAPEMISWWFGVFILDCLTFLGYSQLRKYPDDTEKAKGELIASLDRIWYTHLYRELSRRALQRGFTGRLGNIAYGFVMPFIIHSDHMAAAAGLSNCPPLWFMLVGFVAGSIKWVIIYPAIVMTICNYLYNCSCILAMLKLIFVDVASVLPDMVGERTVAEQIEFVQDITFYAVTIFMIIDLVYKTRNNSS